MPRGAHERGARTRAHVCGRESFASKIDDCIVSPLLDDAVDHLGDALAFNDDCGFTTSGVLPIQQVGVDENHATHDAPPLYVDSE